MGTGIVAAHGASLSPVAKGNAVEPKGYRMIRKKAVKGERGKAVRARGAELLGQYSGKGA